MLRLIGFLILVCVVLPVGIAFAWDNYDLTTLNLLFTDTQAPLVVLLAIAFAIGIVLALIFCIGRMLRLRGQLSGTRRKLKDAEAEIANLRSTSIRDA